MWFGLNRPKETDIEREVGDGLSANVVLTPVRWLQRAFMESHLGIKNDDGEVDFDSDLVRLVQRPNAFYAGTHLFSGTIMSLALDGNAYWLCVRNGRGRAVQLWYIPHFLVEPKWPDDGSQYLTHYEYKVAGQTIRLEPDDVIHFRDGIDPHNLRKGFAPLKSVLREVWTDQEAALFSASLLKNGGVPGLIVSPKAGESISQDEADGVKSYVADNFTRTERGKPLVLSGATDVTQFGFNPRDLDMSALRNVSEERVSALMGVPAAVLGFGTGVQATKVGATLREMRQLAWWNAVIPMQRLIAAEIEHRLAPQFRENGKIVFDNSNVSALQESENERVDRVARLVQSSIWTRGEGREATGQEAGPRDDVYLQPLSTLEVPRGSSVPTPAPDDDAAKERGVKHNHSLVERVAAGEAPRATPPQRFMRALEGMDRERDRVARIAEGELDGFFGELGDAAQAVAVSVLPELRGQALETKDLAQDSSDAARILSGMKMQDRLPIFSQILERTALRVAEAIDPMLADVMGVATGIPDPAARAILATAGRRAGLVDLVGQTRQSLFDALVRGRADGLAGDNLARAILDKVSAGPWSSSRIRAQVIARTETLHAMNVSIVERGRTTEGVEQAMILDNRTGFNDEICTALNGTIVDLERARELVNEEHPNGTRSLVPVNDIAAEELLERRIANDPVEP